MSYCSLQDRARTEVSIDFQYDLVSMERSANMSISVEYTVRSSLLKYSWFKFMKSVTHESSGKHHSIFLYSAGLSPIGPLRIL